MNQKERVIAQIEHQETDLIPYVLEFEIGFRIEDELDRYYGSNLWRSLLDNAIINLPSISDSIWTKNPEAGKYWGDVYGTRWQLDPRPRQVVEPALMSPVFNGYDLPSVEECFDPDWEERAREVINNNDDHFIIAEFGSGLLERSWMLRGFENALMDIALNREFYEELIERLTNHHLALIERLVKLPVDGIMFLDDWGYQQGVLVGAERWREIFKPRYERLFHRVHEADKYVLLHCCGGIDEILPDAIEIGLDVYESVQPEAKNNNPYELKRKNGDRVTFWGGLGSQSTIPFGTPEEIRAEVIRLCTEMARGGGYILAPAKQIQPDTPIENVAAVLEAFLEQFNVAFP